MIQVFSNLPRTTKSRSDILVQRRGRKLLLKPINTTKFIAKLAWASKQTTNSTEDSKVRKNTIFIQTSFNLTWSTKFMAFLTSKLHFDLISIALIQKQAHALVSSKNLPNMKDHQAPILKNLLWSLLNYITILCEVFPIHFPKSVKDYLE